MLGFEKMHIPLDAWPKSKCYVKHNEATEIQLNMHVITEWIGN